MRTIANMTYSAFSYTGAVVGVIAVASVAAFNLQGVAAKTQRHWDADVDRIVAKQQEKKRMAEWASAGQTDPRSVAGEDIETAALATGSVDGGSILDTFDVIGPKKVQAQPTKKNYRQAERRTRHFIPTAFVTLPKFAASTTATVLKLR
jgi:hypothetical protein